MGGVGGSGRRGCVGTTFPPVPQTKYLYLYFFLIFVFLILWLWFWIFMVVGFYGLGRVVFIFFPGWGTGTDERTGAP